MDSWYKFAHSAEEKANDGFDRLGQVVSRNPYRFIGSVLFISILCMLGLLNISIETRAGIVWTPPNSKTKRDMNFIENYFVTIDRSGTLLFEGKSADNFNVLTLNTMEQIWDAHEVITTTVSGKGQTWTELCSIRDVTGECFVNGITQFFNNNRTLYNQVVNSVDDLIDYVSVPTFPAGAAVGRDFIFGNYEVDSSNRVIFAEGTQSIYEVLSEPRESVAVDFENNFIDAAEDFPNSPANVYYAVKGSVDNELARTIAGETYLFVVVYMLMGLITTWVLVKEWNFVDTRIGLACSGIFTIVIAIAAGYGLNMAFGVPFTSIHQVLPFIVVGIGVDDIFIIVAAFDSISEKVPAEERLGKAFRRCGLSILYTTVTDVTAFYLGSISRIPAIHYFCLYAALVLLINFIFQITFFAAILTLDAERRRQRRCDVFYCFQIEIPVTEFSRVKNDNRDARYAEGDTAESDGGGGSSPIDYDHRKEQGKEQEQSSKPRYNQLQRFISEHYVPFITKPMVRVAVVIFFAGLLGVNIFGVTRVQQGFDLIDLAPDDSYLRDFLDAQDRLGLNDISPLELVFKGNQYNEQSVQEEIISVQTGITGLYYISGPVSSWLSDFQAWVTTDAAFPYNNSVNTDGYLTDSSMFYHAVQDFVRLPQYSFYASNIAFENATVGDESTLYIPASRMIMYQVNVNTPLEAVDAMDDARDYAKDTDLNPHPIPYIQYFYLATETEAVIVDEMSLNLSFALVGVVFVSIFLLIKPLAVILMALIVAVVDVDIIGTMYFWGLKVNIMSTMQCVMAIGLVVDYVAHVLHYYMREPTSKSPNQRLHDSLVEIGPSVLLGCTTTFIAVIPVAFATSLVFRTFFNMFISIILYGAGHGLIFLPAILPILPFDNNEPLGNRQGTMDTNTSVEKAGCENEEFSELDKVMEELPRLRSSNDEPGITSPRVHSCDGSSIRSLSEDQASLSGEPASVFCFITTDAEEEVEMNTTQ